MQEPESQSPVEVRSQEEIERICIRNLLACTEERVYFKDLQSRFLLVSQGWLEAEGHGRSLQDVIGRTDFDMFSEEHALLAYADEQEIIRTGKPVVDKLERETFHDRSGAWVSTTKLPLRDDDGRIIGTFGISRDVTGQIEAQNALAHQALHDPVTGLLNRTGLVDRLSQALVALDRHPGHVALLFLDVDDFKSVNDTYGHEVGDHVLAALARRLERLARGTDTVARLGGDEFVVLLTELRDAADVRLVGERLVRALRAPLHTSEGVSLTVSLGAALTTDSLAEPGELLRRADFAMYAAKRAGRNRFEIYDAELHGLVASSRALAADLRHGLENSELFVLFQPVLRLADGAPTGVEALARWLHPERGVIPPSEFIPLGESHGLIAQIDTFVLNEACRQLAAWTSCGAVPETLTLAVNVSSRQLLTRDFVEVVATALDRHRIAPGRLCIEITETALIGELDHAQQVILALSELGVRVALDDFGTGYSTLSHLQQLRTNIVKIDRSFVANIGRESRDREIIAAVTAMSHALGMTVIGEGVETELERAELLNVGCDEAQGFLFSGALPPAEIPEFLAAHAAATAISTSGT